MTSRGSELRSRPRPLIMPPKFRRPPRPAPKDPSNAEEEDDDSFFSRNTKGWNAIDVQAISTFSAVRMVPPKIDMFALQSDV
jgi:hypothetical protein